MQAILVEPQADKNFSIQFFKVSEKERKEIYKTFHQTAKKFTHIFMQGDFDDWMMIEFWTNNINLIIKICEYFENELNIEIKGL